MKLKAAGTLLFLAGMLLSAGCKPTPTTTPSEVIAIYRNTLPANPVDDAWGTAPIHPATLIVQDMVEPRLLEPSITRLQVQAITNGERVAFRLVWEDPTEDTLPGVNRFVDACALQFPKEVAQDVPAPQMGEEGRWVDITYWSAAWQASVDGRPDRIQELYPGAAVDHYPFEAQPLEPGSRKQSEMSDLFSPAQAVGNRRAGPRTSAVEDLVAEGPGSLAPAGTAVSEGRGIRTPTGWEVVLSRPLPNRIGRGDRTQAAFAVWEGSHKETGAKKMRSVWIPVLIEGAP